MNFNWRYALAAAAALFLVFLLVKLRPTWGHRKHLANKFQAARQRIHEAKSAHDRAVALCEAGTLAADHNRRLTSAAGFFLRAMRTEPSSAWVIERTIEALEESRPRLLEKILLRRLEMLPWDDIHRGAVCAAAAGLCDLYERQIRGRRKAEFMRKLLQLLLRPQ